MPKISADGRWIVFVSNRRKERACPKEAASVRNRLSSAMDISEQRVGRPLFCFAPAQALPGEVRLEVPQAAFRELP